MVKLPPQKEIAYKTFDRLIKRAIITLHGCGMTADDIAEELKNVARKIETEVPVEPEVLTGFQEVVE